MRNNLIFPTILLFLAGAVSCERNPEIDQQKPEIDLTILSAFPQNCDTLYFGEPFPFKALFTDNSALGSFSIDIHHNFDQHSHTTEVTQCASDPVKQPVNPYTLIQDFQIPAGLQQYTANVFLTIPTGNSAGAFDPGDYHFFLRLTDKEGWSTQKGLSIKILNRQ